MKQFIFANVQNTGLYDCFIDDDDSDHSGTYVLLNEASERIATLERILSEISDASRSGMGEWYGVVPPYLPANIEVLYDILEWTDEALAPVAASDPEAKP